MKVRVFTMFSEDKYGEWADIKGFEGLYAVSSKGYVASISRPIWNGKAMFISKSKLLKGNVIQNGYNQVSLYKNNKRHLFLVHRLVADAFLENVNNYNQINHKDGNKLNNDITNLEWCDNSLNQLHAWRIGLQKPHDAGKPKRKVCLYKNGNKLVFDCISECARFLNDSGANLQRVLKGERSYNTIKGYKAEYEKN